MFGLNHEKFYALIANNIYCVIAALYWNKIILVTDRLEFVKDMLKWYLNYTLLYKEIQSSIFWCDYVFVDLFSAINSINISKNWNSCLTVAYMNLLYKEVPFQFSGYQDPFLRTRKQTACYYIGNRLQISLVKKKT